MIAEPLGPLTEASGRLDCCGADDDTCHTAFERPLNIGDRAGASTGLHVDAHRRGDRADDLEVAPTARPGAIEVDDVEPGRAGGRVSLGQREGVVFETADLAEVTLAEADGLTSEQVDGGHY